LQTAKEFLPSKSVSNFQTHVHPESIACVFTAMKSLDHLLIAFSRKPFLIDRLNANWLHTHSCLKADFEHLNDNILLADFNSTFPVSLQNITVSSQEFCLLKQSCQHIKQLLNTLLALCLRQHRFDSIKLYTDQCDINFSDNKKSFLSSALNWDIQCIVLDRVLTTSLPPSFIPILLLRPEDIKHVAVLHFQNFVQPALNEYKDLSDFPFRWQAVYEPLDSVDPSLYDHILSPILMDELVTTLASLPSHKAAGLSGITYKMLHLLPDAGCTVLLNLCNQCFLQSDIPEDWRMANVYPIPKPHKFEGLLKNTCPITLLETVCKLLVKILYLRLSKILSSHCVLQGGNFTGLLGGSTTPLIIILDQPL
jgi:hypothetical protein